MAKNKGKNNKGGAEAGDMNNTQAQNKAGGGKKGDSQNKAGGQQEFK